MGHNKASWNPANGRYIFGERDGIHIISLETTQTHLRRAARVVEEVAYHGGLILLAGTRPGQMPIVVRMAELAGACHLFQKWTPGTITNRDTLLAGGVLQIVDEKDRPLPGFEKHLMERRPVIPDLVICLNPLENYTLLKECGMANIPTIGIIDTDADPTWVTYQIPANDDRCDASPPVFLAKSTANVHLIAYDPLLSSPVSSPRLESVDKSADTRTPTRAQSRGGLLRKFSNSSSAITRRRLQRWRSRWSRKFRLREATRLCRPPWSRFGESSGQNCKEYCKSKDVHYGILDFPFCCNILHCVNPYSAPPFCQILLCNFGGAYPGW